MATLLDILLSWYISVPTCNIDHHENMQEKYVNIRANWKDMQHDYVACLHKYVPCWQNPSSMF